ncbi:MAG: trigger factor [Planctomycetaceae bacterium]|jgi:trigger factor|nr:trigger factor [Planctomycetaceae bacterium]
MLELENKNLETTNEENKVAEEDSSLNCSYDIQTISACERKITVTIPREEIDRYFSNEFDDIIKNANVPGFRKGRAPKKLVEKRYRNMVKSRVIGSLVMDSIKPIHSNKELTPISEPDIDLDAIDVPETGPLVFEFQLEVRPEFELPNWEGLKIQKPVKKFSSEDVDHALNRMLTDYGQLVPKDGGAKTGDYIVTRLSFSYEGKEFSSADEETIRIRPTLSFNDGSIKDFDKLMEEVKAGDARETEITLSQDATNANYRGKTVLAKFEIKEVKKLELPEITPEFLKNLGDFDNIDDLKDEIRDALERQLIYEQHRYVRQQVTNSLTISATWELPPALLQRQSSRELQRMILELQRSGYTTQDIRSQINYLRQNSRLVMTQALKEHFILEKIAETENILETDEDYDTEIRLIASQQGLTPRRVRAQLEKQGEMDILRNQIIERKVLDLILSKAVITEYPYEIEGVTEEAIDYAVAGSNKSEIHEATEEDLKAANREQLEKRELGIANKD